MTDAEPGDSTAEIVERFIGEIRKGRRPSIADYLRHHLGVASELRALLPAAAALEGLDAEAELRGDGRIGDFEIVRELGRGGMGVVYEAIQHPLGRRVALKLMTSTLLAQPDALERFRREAAIASRLAHPGICTVYDAGVASGAHFIAMQFVVGETLARRISRRQHAATANPTEHENSLGETLHYSSMRPPVDLPPTRRTASDTPIPAAPAAVPAPPDQVPSITEWIEKAARALHVAHEAGVLHRDIKPGNIMLTPDGEPILLDFGLARDLADDEQHTLTATGDVVGTPAYLAPEQLRGERAERRTDVYALGITLFEALAGRRPFHAPTREALFDAILRTDASSVRALNRAVSGDLAIVVATAIEKDPARRYATALDFAEDLRRARLGEPILARAPSAIGLLVRWIRRHPARATVVAAAALLFAAGVLFAGYFLATRDEVAAARREADRQRMEELLSQAFLHVAFEGSSRAVPLFEEAVAREPSAEAVAGLALALFEDGRSAEALALIDRHPALEVATPCLGLIRANALLGMGRRPDAEAITSRLQPPRSSVDHFIAGLGRLGPASRGDQDAARDAFTEFSDAIAASDRAREIHHVLRVRAAGWTKDPGLLRRAEIPLLDRWPDSAGARLAAGLAHEQADDPAGAARIYETVKGSSSDAIEVQARRVEALRKSGDTDAALALARGLVEAAPTSGLARVALGLVLDGRDDLAAADAYREALRLDPRLVTPLTNLARLARADGHPDVAFEHLDRARTLDPRNATAWYMLGIIELERGRLDEAITALTRCTVLETRHAEAWNALATALATRGEGLDGAPAAREACKLAPGEMRFVETLASLLFESGPVEEAEAACRRILAHDPVSAKTHAMLGRVLMRREKWRDAVEEFTRSLAPKTLPDELASQIAAWKDACAEEHPATRP